jgi:hypothetical protein
MIEEEEIFRQTFRLLKKWNCPHRMRDVVGHVLNRSRDDLRHALESPAMLRHWVVRAMAADASKDNNQDEDNEVLERLVNEVFCVLSGVPHDHIHLIAEEFSRHPLDSILCGLESPAELLRTVTEIHTGLQARGLLP